VLGPLQVAGSFESRIANPWWLDCGAFAGFGQPGSGPFTNTRTRTHTQAWQERDAPLKTLFSPTCTFHGSDLEKLTGVMSTAHSVIQIIQRGERWLLTDVHCHVIPTKMGYCGESTIGHCGPISLMNYPQTQEGPFF